MDAEPSERNDSDLKVEIQKTLLSINETALKIKNELDTINDLIKKNGQLDTTLVDAKKTLTTIGEYMDINIESILSDSENENELQSNLRNVISSDTFQEKLLECLNST